MSNLFWLAILLALIVGPAVAWLQRRRETQDIRREARMRRLWRTHGGGR